MYVLGRTETQRWLTYNTETPHMRIFNASTRLRLHSDFEHRSISILDALELKTAEKYSGLKTQFLEWSR